MSSMVVGNDHPLAGSTASFPGVLPAPSIITFSVCYLDLIVSLCTCLIIEVLSVSGMWRGKAFPFAASLLWQLYVCTLIPFDAHLSCGPSEHERMFLLVSLPLSSWDARWIISVAMC